MIVDHRQGYAWAGSLDADVVAETLAEARDNAAFGAPDECYGLAAPGRRRRRRPRRRSTSGATTLARGPDRREGRARARARARRPRPPTRASAASSRRRTATPRSRAAVANSLGVEAATPAHDVLVLGVRDGRRRHRARRPATASRPAARFADLDLDVAAARRRRARGAAARRRSRSASQRLPVVLRPAGHPLAARRCSAARCQRRGGRRRAARCSSGARARRSPRRVRHARRRPDRSARRSAPRRHDAEGVPTRRVDAHRRRRARAVPAQRLHRRARSARARPGRRCAAASSRRPASARGRCASCPATLSRRGDPRVGAGDALYVQSVSGLHSGTNPVSGDFSVGADGLMVRDGAFAEPVREVTIASTLQRMLLDIVARRRRPHWLPGGAAGMTAPRRRHDHRRHLTDRRWRQRGRRVDARAEGQRMPVAKMTIAGGADDEAVDHERAERVRLHEAQQERDGDEAAHARRRRCPRRTRCRSRAGCRRPSRTCRTPS